MVLIGAAALIAFGLPSSAASTPAAGTGAADQTPAGCEDLLAEAICENVPDPSPGSPGDADAQEACRTLFSGNVCDLARDAQATCRIVFAETVCENVPDDDPTCAQHPPIRITEEAGPEGFVLAEDTPTYRPGSGVVAGDGSEEDPYVISGWCIDGDDVDWQQLPPVPEQDHGLVIKDTDAHVVVEDLLVTDHERGGIVVDGANNVSVADNRIEENRQGVLVSDAEDAVLENNTIRNNTVRGIEASRADGITIEDNLVTGGDGRGVRVVDSSQTEIRANEITDNGYTGLEIQDGVANLVTENVITGNEDGLQLLVSRFTDIRANEISANEDEGLSLSLTRSSSVTDNLIRDQPTGIGIRDAVDTSVNGNDVYGNEDAGLTIRPGGFFWGPSTTVDAKGNYWGAWNGPSGGAADDCTDETASGDGDAIVRLGFDATLCFAPWSSNPNGAGPGT
jgi:parallel beta-helix repeat protein